MATLAIKGHATRGREVIEILEMLGGINRDKYSGDLDKEYYFINNNYVDWGMNEFLESASICCTLEEFFEKYPYKVGDKVKLGYYPCTIQSMEWDKFKGEILYTVKGIDFCKCVYVAELQPYKEETMEGKLISKEELSLKIDTSQMEKRKIIFHTDAPDETELVLGDNFEIKVEDSKTYVVRKKIQYPKTYVECAKILNCFGAAHIDGYKCELLEKFQELLVCRDAYWKIAGEQMGLGKPWEPDYKDGCIKYTITVAENEIYTDVSCIFNYILIFPTEEVRDAFYENFKELIEQCKELL